MTSYEKGFTDALLKVLNILEEERLDPLEYAYDAYELDAIKQSNAALDNVTDIVNAIVPPAHDPRKRPRPRQKATR